MITSATVEDRRNHKEIILQHYYKTLTELLGNKPPFSFQHLLKAYEKCFKFAAIPIIGFAPIICQTANSLKNDEEKKKEIFLRVETLIDDVLEICDS